MAWGTTYIVTTTFLPPGRPLLTAALRALPVGILMLLVYRRLPEGTWWWRAFVLGALNIGLFFALLFVGAYRLPGGVAATVGAIQPLIVTLLATRLLGEPATPRKILAGLGGVAGVALLVLSGEAALDGIGVLAAIGGAVSMAVGVVLTRRWGQPVPLPVYTSWQLVAGGLLLAPMALIVETVPHLTSVNLLGYLYLGAVGTGLAYALWFRGIRRLSASRTSFLALLSPVVATLLGLAVKGEVLTWSQVLGMALVVGSIVAVQTAPRPEAKPAPEPVIDHKGQRATA
jgi:probable blue pigment (indigoidine) exporter